MHLPQDLLLRRRTSPFGPQGTKVTLNYGIIRCPYLYFPKLVSFVYVPVIQLIA